MVEQEDIVAAAFPRDVRNILPKHQPFRDPADSEIHVVKIEMLGVGRNMGDLGSAHSPFPHAERELAEISSEASSSQRHVSQQ